MAGPSGADPVARHYSHDAWNSISATVKLPAKGAVARRPGPRADPDDGGGAALFLVAYPILSATKADPQLRHPASGPPTSAQGCATRPGSRQRRPARDDADQVRVLEAKLARGAALTRPYAVCTVTVPKTARIAEHGRRLDASIRRAGFAPLRLDLAQDVAFAASVVPLGVSLTRTGDA